MLHSNINIVTKVINIVTKMLTTKGNTDQCYAVLRYADQ